MLDTETGPHMLLETRRKAAVAQLTPTQEVKIACTHVSKTFIQKGKQEVPVLADVSVEVHENEFLVILGPGQCGKSTLLRIIAGLETPTTGSVTLAGADGVAREVDRPGSDRGLVFQGYMLFPWKTVLGNVEMGPKLRGLPRSECRDIARRYIELVGLTGFENHYPHQLSGGMKQRVGIARVYANSPEVMLLDEPFGQLDAQTRIFMEQETARIWQAEKRTVIFVTNNIDEALYLGDRIVTMEGKLPGRVQTVYTPNLPRPRDFTDMEFLRLRQEIIDASHLTL